MKQKKHPKKPIFLKRWTYKLLTWLDELLFSGKSTQDFASASQPFWISIVINFWLGMGVIIWSMVDKSSKDQILAIGAGIGLTLALIVTIWYLIGTLKTFPSISVKIFRSIYMLVLSILSFVIGFYSAVIFSFVLIGLFVLMALYYVVFESKTSKDESKPSEYPVYNEGDTDYSNSTGETLKYKSDGLWHDDKGHAYSRSANDYIKRY